MHGYTGEVAQQEKSVRIASDDKLTARALVTSFMPSPAPEGTSSI